MTGLSSPASGDPHNAALRWEDAVRDAVRNGLCDMSTSSGVIETQDGDLGVVFFDESEAYIVKIEPAGLMVLRGE